ncbi:hypothetical protein EZ449_10190 [Pedobacter frigidisoli]|uniref:Uncharacterized protein n=1 Tax=Pedobacter frigidisoli TaxID=2530455 RepID=A0A4R0P0I5_9SPHI|nr:hypothetical protein [Pedobacter frigidisoli]TCD10187.1 hypothetical protein EZ449_10190 [Pedobacter frigidisoli]
METDKIPYQKIIIRTFLQVLLMIVIIFTINSWPSIKESFNGNVPPLQYWLDHSFKISNLILIVGFGAYFYYKGVTDAKEVIANEKKVNDKWDNTEV